MRRAAGFPFGLAPACGVCFVARLASGNVFSADSNRGAVPASAAGGPVVQVRWVSANTLVITRHAGARVFKRKDSVSGVAVAYEKVSAR